MAAELEFRQVDADSADAVALVSAMVAEVGALYGGLDLDAPGMPKAGIVEFSPPGGAFVVGYLDGVAVCGGGLKRLPDGACEIKRMFVVPDVRGRGTARLLLYALEDAARGLGYEVTRLDTGPKQVGAQRLYEAAGYRAIANFNANPVATFFGEKRLT
ncbi:MAG: GNAT family N-acetyltransferase [Mycobacterium sp.]